MVFYFDKIPQGMVAECVKTGEETLGGKRNFAIKYARAHSYDLISFLDDDDLFGPSWIPGLCKQADLDFELGIPDRIYHPQWNVLFSSQSYAVREHLSQDDPRFDSRDMMLYNPWSALCAFHPMYVQWMYHCHTKTDKKYSFEDWTFNLDTWCDGQKHIAIPSTYHFLRMRPNSLGKSTMMNYPIHTLFFRSPELINAKHFTQNLEDSDTVDYEQICSEMTKTMDIEPQLYVHRTPSVHQQINTRTAVVVDRICDVIKKMPFARDVFWMHDHNRIGGAEKAMGWVAEVLRKFKDSDGSAPHQVFIDDSVVQPQTAESVEQWTHCVTHILRSWMGRGPRSLHICNSGPAWNAVVKNPSLFEGVQVYFYVFNDDIMFPNENMNPKEIGYHSPIYNCSHVLDRPNFHFIVDSVHYGNRLGKITGLYDKIKKIRVPSRGLNNKFKFKTTEDGIRKVLWAGRLDHFKGIEQLIEISKRLEGSHEFHVYGDGPKVWTDKLLDAQSSGFLKYGGRYDKSFNFIPGEYDLFLCTSEREGNPNVVREAIMSGLPVLAYNAEWTDEYPSVFKYENIEECISILRDGLSVMTSKEDFSPESCEPSVINAMKEAIV